MGAFLAHLRQCRRGLTSLLALRAALLHREADRLLAVARTPRSGRSREAGTEV
jgi:hypothetical protein